MHLPSCYLGLSLHSRFSVIIPYFTQLSYMYYLQEYESSRWYCCHIWSCALINGGMSVRLYHISQYFILAHPMLLNSFKTAHRYYTLWDFSRKSFWSSRPTWFSFPKHLVANIKRQISQSLCPVFFIKFLSLTKW